MKSLFHYLQDESEWPSISGLQAKVNELSSVTRREISSDSGIHEMTEEKRRSAKRIEYVLLLILLNKSFNYTYFMYKITYKNLPPILRKYSERNCLIHVRGILRILHYFTFFLSHIAGKVVE